MDGSYAAVLFDLFGTLVDERGNAIEGAVPLLAAMPPGRWGIVTSCGRGLASALLAHAGLATPAVLIAAEDVRHGKPAPDGYLEGARRLRVEPARCLAFEDTRSGVRAAIGAGMDVVAIAPFGNDETDGVVRSVRALADVSLDFDRSGVIRLR